MRPDSVPDLGAIQNIYLLTDLLTSAISARCHQSKALSDWRHERRYSVAYIFSVWTRQLHRRSTALTRSTSTSFLIVDFCTTDQQCKMMSLVFPLLFAAAMLLVLLFIAISVRGIAQHCRPINGARQLIFMDFWVFFFSALGRETSQSISQNCLKDVDWRDDDNLT